VRGNAPPAPRRISANQELVSVGVANVFSGFLRGFAVTGSMARTAVANACGVHTPFANLWSVGVCTAALLFFTDALRYTPQAALASVIIVGVLGIVDVHSIKEAIMLGPEAYSDALLNSLTFIAVLCLGVEEGLVLGMLAHLCYMVYRQADPLIIARGMKLVTQSGNNTNSQSGIPNQDSGSPVALAVGTAVHIEVIGPVHYISATRLTAKFRKVREHYAEKLCSYCEMTRNSGKENIPESLDSLALSVNAPTMDINGMGSTSINSTGYASPLPLPIDSKASKEDADHAEVIIQDDFSISDSSANVSIINDFSRNNLSGSHIPTSPNSPFCAVILDISKACELDMSGIHTILSMCESLSRSPPCCHQVVASIHIILSMQVQEWFQEKNVLNKLSLGFAALPVACHLHDTLEDALETARAEGVLVAAYINDRAKPSHHEKVNVADAAGSAQKRNSEMQQPLLNEEDSISLDVISTADSTSNLSLKKGDSQRGANDYASIIAQIDNTQDRFESVQELQHWLSDRGM